MKPMNWFRQLGEKTKAILIVFGIFLFIALGFSFQKLLENMGFLLAG